VQGIDSRIADMTSSVGTVVLSSGRSDVRVLRIGVGEVFDRKDRRTARDVFNRLSDPAPAESIRPFKNGVERRGWFSSKIREVKYSGDETEVADISDLSTSLLSISKRLETGLRG